MYGDTRHISVLKTEFEKNEIDVDDIEIAAARYSPNGKRREERKTKYGGHAGRLNDVLTEPHFRPTTSTTPANTTPKSAAENTTEETSTERKKSPFEGQERSSTMSYTDEIENLKNKYEILLEGAENDYKSSQDESVETNSIFENTTEGHQPIIYNQEKLPENQSSTEKIDSKERQQISSTLKIVKVDQGSFETTTTKKRNGSSAEVVDSEPAASSPVRNLEPIDDLGDMIIVENEGEGGYREQSSSTEKAGTTTTTSTTKNHAPLDRVDDFSAESSEIYTDTKSAGSAFAEDKLKTTLTQSVPQQQQQQPTGSQTMMEGHLYQDAVQKNNNPPIMTGRGV